MEILNNFASIYCFIAFVIGAVFMLTMLSIAAMGKVKEPRNKVRFFIMMGDISNEPYLFIRDVDGNYHLIADADQLSKFGINAFEYSKMPVEEVREVFLNLEVKL